MNNQVTGLKRQIEHLQNELQKKDRIIDDNRTEMSALSKRVSELQEEAVEFA